MSDFLNSRIDEVGEFDFLNKYLLPLFSDNSIGDDVAFINSPGSKIVISSDAGPSNVDVIPKELKFKNQGWLLAIANISDLSSAGAQPLGISNSIDIPGEMLVKDCLEFFMEFKLACDQYRVRVTGGNIRQRKIFSSHATIFGYLEQDDYEIRRTEIQPGDPVYLLGTPAAFVSSYLQARRNGFETLSKHQQNTLLRPSAKMFEMLKLRKQFRIIASTDVSDGVIGSLKNLQDASKVGFEVEEKTIYSAELIHVAEQHKVHPLNLFNFWGDWNIVITIRPDVAKDFEGFCSRNAFPLTRIGGATDDNSIMLKTRNGEKRQIEIVRNENFRSYSFNSNISNSIEYMLSASMVQ